MDIALDKVCALIRQARRFDVKEGRTDPGSGSNPIDDGMVDVLEGGEDASEQEIRSFLTGLNDDERDSLVALLWIGRGDFEAAEWAEAVALAREQRARRVPAYLMGIPDLPDLLGEGLAALGLSCVDEEGGAGV